MPDFTVVSAVSRTLQNVLEAHFADSGDPGLATIKVHLESPREMRTDGIEAGVSLWLYRVTRNEHLLNHPPPRVDEAAMERHPLPVNLHYLVTPISNDVDDEQDLMGRILQTFNDHSIVRGGDLQETLEGTAEELRVTIEMLSIEDLTRIWNALEESYQLSVAYEVQLVSIDSAHEPELAVPIERRDATYAQILAVEGSS